GYEFNLVLAVAALSVAFTGPGALSLDAALGLGMAGVAWGAVAALVAVAGAASQLLQRRPAPAPETASSAASIAARTERIAVPALFEAGPRARSLGDGRPQPPTLARPITRTPALPYAPMQRWSTLRRGSTRVPSS